MTPAATTLTLFSSAMTLSAATLQQKASCMRVRTLYVDASSVTLAPFWGIAAPLRVIANALRLTADTASGIDGTPGVNADA
jgi:hypothetical protein